VDNQIFYLPPIKTVDEASYRRATDYFLRYGRVLVQEMRRGHSELDEGFLLKDGSVVCELMNIWAPNPCGTRPASYRMSAKMEPRMREWSLKLLQSVSWTGVVEMEFFEDIEAGPMLMEINGRFWGGLPAADASGVDFPWLWLQVVTGRETPPKKSYPSPLYARNLERDLPWMVNNLRMPKTDPQRVSARRLLPEIGHVLAGRDRFDEFTRDDTAPGWFLLRWWTRQAARKLRFALLKTALCNRRYAKRAAKLAHNAERIFIISCNNIYRPPFLAELLSQEAKAAGIKLPPIFPRALFNNEGSSTPNEAVENAQTFGVSLTERRSTFLNEAPLSRRDVVILFEKWHVDELRELDKHGRAKIIFFELLCDSPRGARIPDPMWGGADALGIAYKLIARAAHRLVMQLAELPRA
jgi:protein-tyrosine-phosphatase